MRHAVFLSAPDPFMNVQNRPVGAERIRPAISACPTVQKMPEGRISIQRIKVMA